MIFIIVLFLINLNFIIGCDIFLLGQCPAPPSPNIDLNMNQTYCNQFKKHVDCYNKKLINCSNFYEYSSAIETVKLNIIAQIKKVININYYYDCKLDLKSLKFVSKAKNIGCKHLVDKIKLPPGIATLRNYHFDDDDVVINHEHHTKRPKKKTTTSNKDYCTQDKIDKKCNQSDSFVRSILFNETKIETFSYYDEIGCKSTQSYKRCLNLNFEKNCKYALNKTFERLERMSKKCTIRTKHKTTTPSNESSLRNKFLNKYSIFVIVTFNYFVKCF